VSIKNIASFIETGKTLSLKIYIKIIKLYCIIVCFNNFINMSKIVKGKKKIKNLIIYLHFLRVDVTLLTLDEGREKIFIIRSNKSSCAIK